MSEIIKVKLISGIHMHVSAVIVEKKEDIYNKLQIPIEVFDGLFIINHYSWFGTDCLGFHLYEFNYKQGIYDRSCLN